MAERLPPIVVAPAVLEGLEAVQRSGLTNMLDRPVVTRLALEMGHVDTAYWIDENPKLYAEGIFRGFTVEPPR